MATGFSLPGALRRLAGRCTISIRFHPTSPGLPCDCGIRDIKDDNRYERDRNGVANHGESRNAVTCWVHLISSHVVLLRKKIFGRAASSMLWVLAARAPNSCIAISCPTNTASASRAPYLGSRRNEYFGIGRLKLCLRLDGELRVWSVLACDWCLGRLSPPNPSYITSAILAKMP